MAAFRGEKLHSDGPTKQVWYYQDTDAKIDQISKEVFKKVDQVIHYPRGFEGGPKYRTIRKFTYLGFKGKLPVGVVKAHTYGYGFYKTLNPFAWLINDNFDFNEVIVEKGGQVAIDKTNKKLFLNEKALETLNTAFRTIYKKNNGEVDFVLRVNIHKLFPISFKAPNKTYIPNALAHSLESWGNTIDEFSDGDKKAITELFDKLSLSTDFLTKDALAKTKEIVDSKYIQETLKKFQDLVALKTDSESLEKQWQEFLKDNSWIFSYVFAHPVILYKREAYVGGKSIDNTGGKFNDFLIKNSLSDNVSFLEIKTHKTKLFENTAYRGEDVFSATKDLTGCVAQVLNQRDNFQKEFYALKAKSKGTNFETFNSKCVVLIGMFSDLSDNQKYSLELYRNNSRDVEIITFDELLAKIQNLQKVMTT